MQIFLYKIQDHIHPDWSEFLSPSILKELDAIGRKIKTDNFTPGADKVLHFLKLPLKSAKVIIIGQDPYPQENVATGRAFEVGTLESWDQPFRNVSLKNILRSVYYAYTGKILSFKNIIAGNNSIDPPQTFFRNWEKQGVMLLNTAFTCNIGHAGSHSKHWQNFSDKLLTFINQNNPGLIWFLWGNHAIKATENMTIKNKFVSTHPMMCIKDRENDFLYGKINPFKETSHKIQWLNV